MTAEQLLLEQWRSLSPDEQAQVLQFVEFLHFSRSSKAAQDTAALDPNQPSRGALLQALREKIVEAGEPQLNWSEIDEELETRQGGSRGTVL